MPRTTRRTMLLSVGNFDAATLFMVSMSKKYIYPFIVITTPILNLNLCSWAQIKAKMLDSKAT